MVTYKIRYYNYPNDTALADYQVRPLIILNRLQIHEKSCISCFTRYYCLVFHFKRTKLERKHSKIYKGPSENMEKLNSKNKNKSVVIAKK